jgi:hypothetical protein
MINRVMILANLFETSASKKWLKLKKAVHQSKASANQPILDSLHYFGT